MSEKYDTLVCVAVKNDPYLDGAKAQAEEDGYTEEALE